MANEFDNLSGTRRWHILVEAGKKAASDEGYELERRPGRGRSNVFDIERDGEKQIAAIRTTRDRFIAFPPLKTKWKTLDDVDVVIVSTVDDPEDPRNVEVYIFPADEVQKRFTASYDARIKDGQKVRENFGMWLCLDRDDRGIASSVGSGIVDDFSPVAVYPLDDFQIADDVGDFKETTAARPKTIADVMATAVKQIAGIAGVMPDRVKLDLRIEH